MIPYKTLAISEETADAVRSTAVSPGYGHPVHREVASGYGPCRLCLETFEEGEENRLLFTLDAFAGLEPLPLPGPVWLHEEPCDRHPESDRFPSGLRYLPLTFNAYARGRKLLAQEYATGSQVDPAVERLLALPDVAYIHVRNSEAGCYLARIEPTQAEGSAPAADATMCSQCS